jgi:hypothetical protein
VLVAALVLWAWVCVPTILGERTFYLRDVFLTHLPEKSFGASELAAGRIPAFNPGWGLGQPFRGNPNALAFYPDNLFYLALPFWSAFNLHYALHWLLALFAMAALARGLGQGRAASLLAGITYAGSGWLLSALTFYNVLTVAAWWPLVMLGAVRGGRRGIALGGIACGLALLGGEPVTATLGLVPLLFVAISRHGWRRGLGTSVAIGGLGLAVALPQVVATLRVLPFTVRGSLGMSAEQAAKFKLHPLRLLELLFPFPFGWPTYLGPKSIWAVSVLPSVPLFFSLYAGIVALWLGLAAARKHRGWALLALAGPGVAVLAGLSGDLLVSVGFGLFRFPEKFVLWLALALPILAGYGLERALDEGLGAWRKIAAIVGGIFLALAGAVTLVGPMIIAGVTRTLQSGGALASGLPDAKQSLALALLSSQIGSWRLALFLGGTLLLLAFFATRPNVPRPWAAAGLVGLQLAALVQLYPLPTTDETAPYRKIYPWVRGAAVLSTLNAFPAWGPDPAFDLPSGPHRSVDRFWAQNLNPAPGALQDLTYPLAPDLEGMHSPLFKPMLDALPTLDWERRSHWFRSVGLQAFATFDGPAAPNVPDALHLLDEKEGLGVRTLLYTVDRPAPPAWWPPRLIATATSDDAFRQVNENPDSVGTVAVTLEGYGPLPAQDLEGSVRLISSAPDRIEIETESQGGLAVIRRAWQPLLVAREGRREIATRPVNLNLLGVEVPAGRHRVVLEVSAWPEILAGGVALLALIAGLISLLARRR